MPKYQHIYKKLHKQHLSSAYDIEPLGRGAYIYSLHNSRVSILNDSGGITIYEKRPLSTTTEIIELTNDEAFTLYSILRTIYQESPDHDTRIKTSPSPRP